MTPKTAMYEQAAMSAFQALLGRRPGKPGEYVAALPDEIRAQLKELRSQDIADVADHVVKALVIPR